MGNTLPVPSKLQPQSHVYAGYQGPWIEDYFARFWKYGDGPTDWTYIPIYWTDIYVRSGKDLGSQIQSFLDATLDPQHRYFTVVQHDLGIRERLPDNVLVFGAGAGDVPIPMLKGELLPRWLSRDIVVSFCGQIGTARARDHRGVRARMVETCNEYALIGHGPDWQQVMARSVFSLCPRGYGRTSFRLYESLQLGSIPVYIWDDCEWLPFRDVIDWSEIAILIHVDDLAQLRDLIEQHSPADIAAKQKKIFQLRHDYFTLEGVSRQIVRMLSAYAPS